jgi:tetratricopeptide (TPR) repeat protein
MSAGMRTSALAVAAALAGAPGAVRADDAPVPAKARTLAERGRAFHDAGDYPHAIAAFTQAYVIAPSPALLFNLAQAYRLQGNCDDAALMYRRYLATNPDAEQRALAELHLASVERCLHKIALHIPVETAAGRPIVAAPAAPLIATERAVAPPRRAQIEKDIGIGLAIGGSVSLAIAGYYTVQARSAADDVAAAYAQGAKWKDVAPDDERGKSAASAARLFGVGGALGIAGGVVTYLIGRHDEQQPPVTIATTRNSVSLDVRWAF